MSAPIVQLGDVETATFTSGSTYTADKPAGVSDGDLLVAVVYGRNSTQTFTPPSGWTSAPSQNTSGTLGIFTKPIPSASAETATNYSWSISGGSGRGIVVVFRVADVRRVTPVDATGTAVTSGTSSIVAPAVTAVAAETVLIGAFVCNRGDSTQSVISAPTTAGVMTEVAGVAVSTGAATSYLEVAYQTLSSAGSTGSRTAAVSPAATSAAGLMLTLAPIATASATLTASAALSAAAQQVHGAATVLTAAAGVTGTAGGQQQLGSVSLQAAASLSAIPGYSDLSSLSVDGVWRPATLYELVSGSWVES